MVVFPLSASLIGPSSSHPLFLCVTLPSPSPLPPLSQILTADSDNYLKALQSGDAWVAIGWSSDVVAFLRRNRNVAAAVPREGTVLFADLWVSDGGGEERVGERRVVEGRKFGSLSSEFEG